MRQDERRAILAKEEPRLTPREREVARLVGEGLANKEIAHRLGVTTQTVKAHLGTVYAKTRVKNRVALALSVREEE
ncbi:MAG: LuxR C-terminal-related transcriptional regulator [Methyloceanibacter sp.]